MPDILSILEKSCKKFLKQWTKNGIVPYGFSVTNFCFDYEITLDISSSAQGNTKISMYIETGFRLNEYGICIIKKNGTFKLLNKQWLALDINEEILATIQKSLNEIDRFYDFAEHRCCDKIIFDQGPFFWNSELKHWQIGNNENPVINCPWCFTALPGLHMKQEKKINTYGRFSAITEKICLKK